MLLLPALKRLFLLHIDRTLKNGEETPNPFVYEEDIRER